MISTRLNSDLKPSFMLFIDENPSSSALAFQVAYAFALEVANRFDKKNLLLCLTEPTRKCRFDSKFQLVNETFLDQIELKNDEKSLILIDCLSWLIFEKSESFLIRRFNEWRKNHLIIGVLPFDCLDDEKTLKNFLSISDWTTRVRLNSNVEMRIEKRGKTSVDTIKSILRFSFDENLNIVQLREEKLTKKKSTTTTNSSTDVTANLTFNLRLKDDELTAKNQLVLPYTKQNSTTDDQFTIHYSYEKEDDIDEDEDDDLTL